MESPISFDLLSVMGVFGALFRRGAWVDQIGFRIYPNMSVLLVGPSGMGKDTSLGAVKKFAQSVGTVPILGGKTSEAIFEGLLNCGEPAAAMIFAPEMAEFFGSKDYQKGMLQDMTDILSNLEYKDISLKSRQGCIIREPTITMLCGSTPSWLYKAMPDGSMGGGFYPRFVIACESEVKRKVAWIKYDIPPKELSEALGAYRAFNDYAATLVKDFRSVGEVIPTPDARARYTEWYDTREADFSPLAQPYAHRCRDHCMKLAMISALGRGHIVMDLADIEFAITTIRYIAKTVDAALGMPSADAMVAREVMKLLPAQWSDVLMGIGQQYSRNELLRARDYLLDSKQIHHSTSGMYHKF